jgi:hypothetical protein
MDLEAVGGAATGGLIAGAIEKPTGHAGEPQHACSDCGAELAGRFCHNCGQPAHVHRTLLHLGEELLHGVMHFDGRIWRTLPLLFFRPGRLTREWVEGKRTRYVSPLAMFLFTAFVLFMALSYMPSGAQKETKTFAEVQAEAVQELAREKAQLAKAEADLKAAAPDDVADETRDFENARRDLAKAQAQVDGLAKLQAAGVTSGDWKELLKAQGVREDSVFKTGDAKLDVKIAEKLKNPELALYKFEQTFYKFSFLLVPISIPFVAALFLWKRGYTLYDHGVFILYSLTFVSTAIMLTALAFRLDLAGWAVLGITFAIPAHMFFQLKGAYRLRLWSALWRTFVLLIFCNVALSLFLLAVLRLGMA